jgi:hypothetical protein
VLLLLPPLSVDTLPLDGNEDPIPPSEEEEDEAADKDECEPFFANKWSCVSEITIIDESVRVAIIVNSRIVFRPTTLLSCKCCIRNLFPKAV